MNNYSVFFRGEYQGQYSGSSSAAAFILAANDYGWNYYEAIESFGNHYSAIKI